MVRRQAQPSQLALGRHCGRSAPRPGEGWRVIDCGRGRTDTVGLSRHCAQPTPLPGEGRESRGLEAGSDSHSWPEPTLWAA